MLCFKTSETKTFRTVYWGISGFEFFPINFKMNTLLSNVEYDTCKYIADGMDLRNFLASNPKPCD